MPAVAGDIHRSLREPLLDNFQEEKKVDDGDNIHLPSSKEEDNNNSFEKRDSMPATNDFQVAVSSSTRSDSNIPASSVDKSTPLPPTKTATRKSSSRPMVRYTGYAMRTILMDVPLLLLLLIYAAVVWFHYVHDSYLIPQLRALPFHDDRVEMTYYHRRCEDESDMSTFNGEDLFLPVTATADEAYQHQLKHGFTIFQGILQPQTCENLRNFVISRNHNLTAQESIFVIENENRYSFGLGTEEPSVTAAMKELANSPRLRPALEAILGPDPALIEMTAITATYGAAAQWWHDDVVAHASAVQFGRFFGPSYSIFVQLQNTTKEMGATTACPGTHYCGGGAMKDFCDRSGFQLVGDNGFWGQGDALLMNMNSWHRGAAHTDPDALDRVMLILTFVPKPVSRAESRQMSQGITFSLRWDMWGHTLNDLAQADTAMSQPWATLRALGLYKKKSTSWGIDYISSASMRTANNDNGFQQQNLEAFLEDGGFWFLPRWLQQFNIDWDADESWPEFIHDTQSMCHVFFTKAVKYALAAYIAMVVLLSLLPGQQRSLHRFAWSMLRLGVMVSLVALLAYLAKERVDSTGWAADIRAGRKYGSTVEAERTFFKEEYRLGQSTYPTKHDVLIETRYGSKQLAVYNDFIPLGHPGNIFFNSLIQSAVPQYDGYNSFFKAATETYITETVATNSGRFLYQGPDGFWFYVDYDDALEFVRKELMMASNDLLAALMRTIRFMESDYKYGIYRETAFAFNHAVPYLGTLRKQLALPRTQRKIVSKKPKQAPSQIRLLQRTFILPSANSSARATSRTTRDIHAPRQVEPPYLGAWLAEGDSAEGYENGSWYYGQLVSVNAFGDYEFRFSDGTVVNFDQYTIRPFEEYYLGEHLECYVDDREDFYPCTIREVGPTNASFLASLDGEKGKVKRYFKGFFRRRGVQSRTKIAYVDLYRGEQEEEEED